MFVFGYNSMVELEGINEILLCVYLWDENSNKIWIIIFY